MRLINRKTFVFLITIMLFAVNTIFIFCFYIENALAGDITHSECTSVLTVGIPSNSPPVAKANGPCYAIVNQNIIFDGSESYDSDGTIINYKWDFGDNSNESGVNPNHTYFIGGKYTATLTVTDDNGDTASDIIQVIITKSQSVHLMRFNFLQRLVDRFPRLTRLFHLLIFNKLSGFQ